MPTPLPESESVPRSVSPCGDPPATSTDLDTSTLTLHLRQEPFQSLQAEPGGQEPNSTPERSGPTLTDPASGGTLINTELLTYLQSISTPHFNQAIRPYSLEQLVADGTLIDTPKRNCQKRKIIRRHRFPRAMATSKRKPSFVASNTKKQAILTMAASLPKARPETPSHGGSIHGLNHEQSQFLTANVSTTRTRQES